MRPSLALLVGAVLASGCGEAAPAVAVSRQAEATPEPPQPEPCPDWSERDLSSLPKLPKGRHVNLLGEVWQRVLDMYYDPTLGCLDWPALRGVYAARVAAARDSKQAYEAINEMLGELRQSHFRLYPPGGDGQAIRPASPPMTVRWIDDAMVVVDSRARGHLGPIPAGATVLGVDDKSVAQMVKRARERSRGPSDFAFQVRRTLRAHLSCSRPGLVKRVRITDPRKEHREAVRMVECEKPEGELLSLGNLKDVPSRVEHRLVEGTEVGYLAFNIWMLPMIKSVEAAMADLRDKGMTALILDLRGNPGGVGAMSVPVARLLLTESASLGKVQLREFPQEFNVEAEPSAFGGPVVVLVDEGTASTSEIFVAGMRDLGRITVFGGRATAGAALPSVIETLSGGAILQYVVGDYHSPSGTVVEGEGITPDVVVPETRDDFAAGRDPVLEAAVEHLKKAQ